MSQDPNIEKLRKARHRLGYSQLELAKLIPLDRAYLSELENGRKRIQEWVMDKIEKLERQRAENYDTGHGVLTSRVVAADLPVILEQMAAGQSARSLLDTVKRIASDDRISDGGRALCGEILSGKAGEASAAKRPDRIQGLSSELTAAQRAGEARQRALAQSGSQGSSPSPKAGGPSGGKRTPGRGTGGRHKSRRSVRGPAQV